MLDKDFGRVKSELEELAEVLREPLRSYQFSVTLPDDIPGARDASKLVIAVEGGGLTLEGDVMPFVPNLDITLPTTSSVAPLTITFVESETTAVVSKMLSYWKKLMLRNNMELYPPKNYMRTITVALLNRSSEPIKVIKYHYAYPTNFYETHLSHEADEIYRVQVNFNFGLLDVSYPSAKNTSASDVNK